MLCKYRKILTILTSTYLKKIIRIDFLFRMHGVKRCNHPNFKYLWFEGFKLTAFFYIVMFCKVFYFFVGYLEKLFSDIRWRRKKPCRILQYRKMMSTWNLQRFLFQMEPDEMRQSWKNLINGLLMIIMNLELL